MTSILGPPLRMRKSEKAITQLALIEAVIRNAQICRLALPDKPYPYIVPLSFGYQNRTLYFHSAHEGRKIDLISNCAQVGFEIDIHCRLVPSEKPCAYSMQFQSVIGGGDVRFIDNPGEKRHALDVIMNHYTGRRFAIDTRALDKTLVFCLDIRFMTGKESGMPSAESNRPC